MMKYFSMFSGIGGFENGIQQAYNNKHATSNKQNQERRDRTVDVPELLFCSTEITPLCVGYSEIDKYAIQIYERHFGGHKNYGNARDIKPEELPDFDMLCGGVPCQSWSIAGKRKGFEDVRGTMWFEVFRIVNIKKPKYLLLENVKGLLSHDGGKSFEKLCEMICEMGYVVDFTVLNSKYWGVPQNRERVFILAVREDCLQKEKVI